MTEANSKLTSSPANRSNRSIRLCVLLGLLLLLSLPLFAYVGHSKHGADGAVAAVVAAAVCFIAGAVAIFVTGLLHSVGQGMNGLLLSMLIRTGVPLIAGLTLQMQGGPLAKAGVFGMILLNYLIMLMIETISAVSIVQSGATPTTSINHVETTATKGLNP